MEFLRPFLRRPFAGKLEVASANVGSFLRLSPNRPIVAISCPGSRLLVPPEQQRGLVDPSNEVEDG